MGQSQEKPYLRGCSRPDPRAWIGRQTVREEAVGTSFEKVSAAPVFPWLHPESHGSTTGLVPINT